MNKQTPEGPRKFFVKLSLNLNWNIIQPHKALPYYREIH